MNIGKVARATERAQGRAEVVNNGDRTALERNPIVVELLFKKQGVPFIRPTDNLLSAVEGVAPVTLKRLHGVGFEPTHPYGYQNARRDCSREMMRTFYLALVIAFSRFHINSAQCTNGGQLVATGCTFASQCTSYTNQPVSCINGFCCTVPSGARCSNGGTAVALGCTNSAQCTSYSKQPVTCLSGTCCTVPSSLTCSNGGAVVATGCSTSQQCARYTTQA
uniref:EB domain-containing protein n=1 Tax=Ascaris lumbricoides TaxID=6252 RepID=A0A9J2Q179_ASCLU